MDSLRLEAAHYQQGFSERIFNSVYIGGGTPTVLSFEQLEDLIGIVRRHFQISGDAEYTVEANPNTVSGPQLMLLRSRGINRLSLGIQSFHDAVLKTLGRIHSVQDSVDAFNLARNAGFTNIGIDLIYGVPGQTSDQWTETLERAISLKPEHVSAYSLSLDEGSWFKNEAEAGRFALPEDEHVAIMYEHALEMLEQAGYGRYEISNFSLPGFACRHNMNYWERGEYLGLGPGAWSFIDGKRSGNIADAREYSRRLSSNLTVMEVHETVAAEPAATEAILLGLRTTKGLDLDRFEGEYGPDLLRRLEMNSVPLKAAGLLQVTNGRLRLTDRGILLSNEALARLSV